MVCECMKRCQNGSGGAGIFPILCLTRLIRHDIIKLMKMTRQHFQALADACAEIIIRTNADRAETQAIVEEIAMVCKVSNPNFDSIRFDDWVQDILIKNS